MAEKHMSPEAASKAIRELEKLVRRDTLTSSLAATTELERLVAQRSAEALRKVLENIGGTYGLTQAVAASAALPEMASLTLPGLDGLRHVVLPARVTAPDLSPDTASGSGGQTSPDPVAETAHQLLTPQDLGRLVRQARERMSLTQQAFADLAGVGRRFLSELENGKETLELGKVMRVASAAGISLFARER
jgi:HTH-type transcriptional regulator/antitoxin HipB